MRHLASVGIVLIVAAAAFVFWPRVIVTTGTPAAPAAPAAAQAAALANANTSGPLLVSGTLVDSSGAPLADVVLQAAKVFETASSSVLAGLPQSITRTAADGSFTIFGREEDATLERLRLQVAPPHRTPAPFDFAPGATNVRVVAAHGAAIVVSFDRRPTTEDGGHRVHVELDVPYVERRVGNFEAESNTCRFENLGPGHYRVRVTVGRDVLVDAVNVVVSEDGAVSDEGLADLELSEFAREVTVRVVDTDRQPVAGAQVISHLAGRSEGTAPTDARGETALLAGPSGLRLTASKTGYVTARQDDVTEDVTLVLDRPRIVRVQCDADLSSVPDGYSIVPSLKLVRETRVPDGPGRRGDGEPIDRSTGAGTAPIERTGTHKVRWMLRRDRRKASRRGRGFSSVPIGKPVEIDIESADDVVTIPLTPEDLAAAIERLAGR